MDKAKIMVVDDSALMRKIISEVINQDASLTVSTTASNGQIALNKIRQSTPDLITLDIEMPQMDGLAALREIRKLNADVPIIICSSLTKSGAEITLEALLHGASDYITKASHDHIGSVGYTSFGQELTGKIKSLLHTHKPKKVKPQPIRPVPEKTQNRLISEQDLSIIAIGVSTGGPAALAEIIPEIPANIQVPIIIVQHMPKIFTNILANSLNKKTPLQVVEARDGDHLMPGKIWIAPGDYHMSVIKNGKNYQLGLNQDPPLHYCRPAVDVMLHSVATCYGSRALAIILTGMGRDGLAGCQAIKQHEGIVLAQDEPTSVVWGMPGAVAKAGLADQVLPLNQIIDVTVAHMSKASIQHG